MKPWTTGKKARFFADVPVIFRDNRHYLFEEKFFFDIGERVASAFSSEADEAVITLANGAAAASELSHSTIIKYA